MRFSTFLVTGKEVLHLGGETWESNLWPPSHWRANKGRWRLFTTEIDAFVSRELKGKTYGGDVEGLVVALEVADFLAWPVQTFAPRDAVPSYKTKRRDLWCFAKMDWLEIHLLTVRQQYLAYSNAVLAALHRFGATKRKPKGFDATALELDLAAIFASGKSSQFTRAVHAKST